MSKLKANAYPAWIVSNYFQVCAIDNQNQLHEKSKVNFAASLGISEDGTLWALSMASDPDGGGGKIFWSNGDGQWTEIDTPDPGAIRISGFTGSSCLYLSNDHILRAIDTSGTANTLYDSNSLYDTDYGGGKIWGLLSEKAGEEVTLHYADAAVQPLRFQPFGSGDTFPMSLSVNHAGDCYGLKNRSPRYYAKDGQNSGAVGSGANHQTLEISFKKRAYLITIDGNAEGNAVYVWEDTDGGKFKDIGIRAYRVLSTYYEP